MVNSTIQTYRLNPYIFFSFFIVAFIIIIYYQNKKADNYKVVKPQENIAKITLHGDEGYGSLRGAVFYKKNHFIGEAILFNIVCNDLQSVKKLNINPKDLSVLSFKLPFTLSDLNYPYSLKKVDKKIYVEKEDCKLVFDLMPYDGLYK